VPNALRAEIQKRLGCEREKLRQNSLGSMAANWGRHWYSLRERVLGNSAGPQSRTLTAIARWYTLVAGAIGRQMPPDPCYARGLSARASDFVGAAAAKPIASKVGGVGGAIEFIGHIHVVGVLWLTSLSGPTRTVACRNWRPSKP